MRPTYCSSCSKILIHLLSKPNNTWMYSFYDVKIIRNVDVTASDCIVKIKIRCMMLNSNASVERQMQSKNSYYLIT